MPKFEKPQEGNPHGLVINQHTFPAKSIARFADTDGRVHLEMKPAGPIWRAKPTDSIFCARRAWDYDAEVGLMKMIEDRFQQLADLIIDGRVLTFDAEQTHDISSFYALWMARAEIRDQPGKDAVARGMMPSARRWSKDEEEGLEKARLAFFRGATMPAHVVNGPRATILVARHLRQTNPTAIWGVIRASGGEFVVPDWPFVHPFIPINPTLALVNHAINQTLDRDAVRIVNKQLRAASRCYFFARDLATSL